MNYLNLFFTEEYDCVPPANGEGGDSASFNSLEGIFYLVKSALIAENGDVVFGSLPGFAHDI